MPAPRLLRKAPITEALIDFRVKARADLQAVELEAAKSRIHDRFPNMKARRGVQFTAELAEGKHPASKVEDLGLDGYLFTSADEKTIVQFRVDGLTLNRLKPYGKWEEYFPLAMELWGLYCEVARPVVATRLAVRYINHVPLPVPLRAFEDYLMAAPQLPSELPQHMSSFLTKVTVYDPSTTLAAHITQVLQAAPGSLAVIIDIDAYKEGEYELKDPAIRDVFLGLRSLKNRIFFGSLTEKALEQLQ